MMPAHYALSDAAIVLVAVWAGVALWRHAQILPAFAMACFGIAAAVGAVRIGGGLQAELASLHMGASQLLGLAGAMALAAACLPRIGGSNGMGLIGAMLILAAATLFLARPLVAPAFLSALVVAGGIALWRAVRQEAGWLLPAGFALLLANALFIRRAPWLDEAVAWHGYHLLIALALAMLARGMLRGRLG